MATGSGMTSQIGWVDEVTYGTAVTVTKFGSFMSESIGETFGRVTADDIVAGAQTMRQAQTRAGNNTFGGGIDSILTARHSQHWFKHILGDDTITGAGPYTHTCTPSDHSGLSFTTQVGRTDPGGTVNPFTYSGCKLQGLSVSGSMDGDGSYIDMSADVIAKDSSTAVGLASASYLADNTRYTNRDATMTVDGNTICWTAFDFTLANSFEQFRCGGSATIEEPTRDGPVTLTGNFTFKWTDLVEYNLVKNMTHAPLVITIANGADSIVLTSTCRYDSTAANVEGKGVLFQTIGFADAGTSDSDGISVVVTNADAT